MGNTPMERRALSQNTNTSFLNLRTIYLFQLSQWIKTWIMQSSFSLNLHFFTYFANQLPGFSIGGTFGLTLVKNSNSAWKYCISLNKYTGFNTQTYYVKMLGVEKCRTLSFLYALTGCYTVSSLLEERKRLHGMHGAAFLKLLNAFWGIYILYSYFFLISY